MSINIKECLDLYDTGAFDISLFAIHTGKNIKADKNHHTAYLERMAQFKDQFSWDSLQLPSKSAIEQWTHLPTMITLMNRNVWTEKTASLWFTDYMRWLYSSMRLISEHKNNYTLPMVSILMDSVFHSYLEQSLAYFDMCRSLFNMEYIPHTPGPRIMYEDEQLQMLVKSLELEIQALEQDWGEDYVNRVFEYEMDMVRLRLDKKVTIKDCVKLCGEKRGRLSRLWGI